MDEHNYMKKILNLVAEGKLDPAPGEVRHVYTLHDDWCAFWDGGLCNCDCEIEIILENEAQPTDD